MNKNPIVGRVKQLAVRLGIPAYNEHEHKGFLRHVETVVLMSRVV
mgnify:CR=1 FL=1